MFQIISKDSIVPNVWNGGITYEYFIYPNSAAYSNRDFDFRISCASIDKTPSDFSKFLGYSRYLLMLDTDLKIVHNDSELFVEKNSVFNFNSNDRITSFSLGNDFNLMVKQDFAEVVISLGKVNQLFDNNWIFIFTPKNAVLTIDEQTLNLKAGDLFLYHNINKNYIQLNCNHDVVVGVLDYN